MWMGFVSNTHPYVRIKGCANPIVSAQDQWGPGLPQSNFYVCLWQGTLRRVTTLSSLVFNPPPPPRNDLLLPAYCKVEAGSSLAIVGASGCGKSTVLRLITRLYDPQSGTIELDGVPLHTLEPRGLRDRVRKRGKERSEYATSKRRGGGGG